MKMEKHKIPKPQRNIPNPNLGIDGRAYDAPEALRQANKVYIRDIFTKIKLEQR